MDKQEKSHMATRTRLKNGEITRPEVCTRCSNKNNIQAHHPNYDMPEYIIWLCRKCHIKIHKKSAIQERKRRKELLKMRLGNINHLVNMTG